MVFGLFSKKKNILKAIHDRSVDEVSSLLKKYHKINETFSRPDNEDILNWSYLLHACKFGNKEIVKLILEKGADLNNQGSDEAPPLYWASCNEDDKDAVNICTFLIEKGVDINHRTKDRGTALLGAAINTNDRTLKLLLKSGADPNLQKENGFSALYAAASRSVEAVKLLLKHNAEPNIENTIKTTPIFETAFGPSSADNIEIAIALIKAGADINHGVETPGGMVYPLDVAVGENNQALANYLYSKGAKYNSDTTNLEIIVDINGEE